MAVAKIYNSQTGQWEAVIVGTTGDTGVVQSATEPSNTDQLWLDTDDTAEPLAIPAGGSAGQILQKSTDGDYDTAWSNVPSHNYIINGAFDFWQRGDGPTTETSDSFTADRWKIRTGGITNIVWEKQDFTRDELQAIGFGEANSYASFTFTGTTSGLTDVSQHIEDVRTLAGQTVTLSFWVKGSEAVANVFARPLRNYGSGGSSVDFAAGGQGYSVSTSWERKSLTFNFADLTGKTIGAGSYLWIELVRQTVTDASNLDGVTLSFWGVQLEAGSIATPFKRNANSIAGELAACQRYFEIIEHYEGAGTARDSSTALFNYNLKVNKRATPTLSFGSTTYTFDVTGIASKTGTGQASTIASSKTVVWQVTGSSGLTVGQHVVFTGGNVLVSAEL